MNNRNNGSMQRGRGIVIGILACLLILSLAPACRKRAKEGPPPPPAVTVAEPAQRRIMDYLDLTGSTQAIRTVQLQARVAGFLEKVLFQDGQFVKKDQLLFVIQQNTYQANLQQAEGAILQLDAQLKYAESQLARYSRLLSERGASQSDVDNWRYQRDSAAAGLVTARAKRDLAVLDLGYTEVRAPFDGRIDRRLKDPGNLVGSGENTVLVSINQVDPIYVYFNISDQDLSRLIAESRWVPGRLPAKVWPMYLGFHAEESYPHKGYLDFASISLTPTTGTLLLRGIFRNQDGKIAPGLYGRVRVPVKEREALLVPDEAIGHDQQGPYVLAVNGKNTVVRIGVKTGALVDNCRVIEQGLSGKERIVVKGTQKAIPGRPVTPERSVLPGKKAAS